MIAEYPVKAAKVLIRTKSNTESDAKGQGGADNDDAMQVGDGADKKDKVTLVGFCDS